MQKMSYIDQATAKQFDEMIGHEAYFDNVNSVQCILHTASWKANINKTWRNVCRSSNSDKKWCSGCT
jgi:hypothetical protein